VLVFIGAVTRYGAPLRAVQLLWVNLIMDTLAALALATEPPTDDLLLQKPHGKTERIINNIMWKHIMGHALTQLAVLLGLLYGAHQIPWTGGYILLQSTAQYTIVFNSFVWMQLFNELNARSIDDHQNIFSNLHKSYIFIGVLVVSAGLQAIIVEFGSSAFKVRPLSWDQWLFCIAMGTIEIPVGFLLRALPNPERHYIDIIQFWNKVEPVRVTKTSFEQLYDSDSEEIRMVEAKLLPYEDALNEIEAAKLEKRKQDEEEDARKLAAYAEEAAEHKAQKKAQKAAAKEAEELK
jgi:magnesium-transporting ATPase (P-type)